MEWGVLVVRLVGVVLEWEVVAAWGVSEVQLVGVALEWEVLEVHQGGAALVALLVVRHQLALLVAVDLEVVEEEARVVLPPAVNGTATTQMDRVAVVVVVE